MIVPGKYKTAGTVMLVAGIFNVFWSLFLGVVLFLYVSAIAIGTFGLGCFLYGCMIWPLVPLAMGITEIIVGAKAMGGAPAPAARTTAIVGLVCAVLNMSVIPLILEIVALVSLNDDEVAAWLRDA